MPFNTPQKKWAPNRSVDNSQLKSPMSNSPRQLNSSRITPDRLSNTVHFNRYSSMNGSMSPMGMSCPRPKNILTPNNISQGPLGFKQPDLTQPFMKMNNLQQRHHLTNGSPMVAYSSLSYSQRDIHLTNISPVPQRRLSRRNSNMSNGSMIKIPSVSEELRLSSNMKRTYTDTARHSGTPESMKRQRLDGDRCSTSTTNPSTRASSRSVTPVTEPRTPTVPAKPPLTPPTYAEIIKRPADTEILPSDDQNNNRNNEEAPHKKRQRIVVSSYHGDRNPIDASLSSSRRYKISQKRRQKNDEMQLAKKKFSEINVASKTTDHQTNRVGFINESLYNDEDEDNEANKMELKSPVEYKNITSEDIERRKASEAKRALHLLGIETTSISTSKTISQTAAVPLPTVKSMATTVATTTSTDVTTGSKSVAVAKTSESLRTSFSTKPSVPSPLTVVTTLSGGIQPVSTLKFTTPQASTVVTLTPATPTLQADSLNKGEKDKPEVSQFIQKSPVKSSIPKETEIVPQSTASKVSSSQFSFGAKTTTVPSSVNPIASDKTTVAPATKAATANLSGFKFTAPSSVNSSSPKFSFGAAPGDKTKAVTTSAASAPSFNFGSPITSTTTATTTSAAVAFTTPSTINSTPLFNSKIGEALSTPTLGSDLVTAPKTVNTAPTSAVFSFGVTPKQAPPPASTAVAASTAPNSSFAFSMPVQTTEPIAKTTTVTAAPGFSFGGGATTPSFGAKPVVTTAVTQASSSTFNFGSPAFGAKPAEVAAKTADTTSTPAGIQFGAMPSTVASKVTASSSSSSILTNGFSFGKKADEPPLATSTPALFGAKPATASFTFGAPVPTATPTTTAAAAAPSSTFSFGKTTTPFGAATTAASTTASPFASGFAAAPPTTKPLFSSASTPSFNTTVAPTFGAKQPNTFAFGAKPVEEPSKGAFNFGATAAVKPVSNGGFGVQPTPQNPFAGPSITAAAAAPSPFGSTAATTTKPFGFAAPASTPFGSQVAPPSFAASQSASASPFGVVAQPPAAVTPVFGAPAVAAPIPTFGAAPVATLAFGATPAFGAAPAPSTGFNFSAAAAGAGTFNFAAPAVAAPVPAFGVAPPTPTFGAGAPAPAFGTTTPTNPNIQNRVTRKARRRR